MYIRVKVEASTKIEKIIKKSDSYYLISVKEPAERNLANKRVCEIIASFYEIDIGKVRIISGHHHPSKILSINL